MGTNSKSLPLLFIVSFALLFCIAINTANGDSFIPPVPDKAKTLPANDGGSDGCNSSRFECVMGGEAVLDKQTGLIWARNAYIIGKLENRLPWEEAIKLCQNIEIGGQKGWRMPTRDELITLLDTSQSAPSLPEGHPFTNTGGNEGGWGYWTSTEYGSDINSAWRIGTFFGKVQDSLKVFDHGVWPVRDGE